jgi:Deacetylases, including yeast histone deacetylase and acetoin utilization protein
MVHGLNRIAVVDFDVHHGNGTQAIFEAESTLFYASSHQFPLYPGTGHPSERGMNNNIVNIGLPPASGSGLFRDAIHRIIDQLQRFQPEMLMISAGFDGHRKTPLQAFCSMKKTFIGPPCNWLYLQRMRATTALSPPWKVVMTLRRWQRRRRRMLRH